MKRTDQQRKAIEVYCDNVAEAMNSAGHGLKAVLEQKALDVPCTQENMKEIIFKGIARAMFNKLSTTELNTAEVNEVYEVMNRWLGEKFGVHVPFPCEDDDG